MTQEEIVNAYIDIRFLGKEWIGQFKGKREPFPSLVLAEKGGKGKRIFSYGQYSWAAAERIVLDGKAKL